MGEDGAPDIRVLWDRTAKARKVYRCNRCAEQIEVGEAYTSLGTVTDGEFRHDRSHPRAWGYPSGCPKLRERDLVEIQAQFDADQERHFPGDRP